ncbi:MAG: ABC transporter permease [Acidobacteria bacterium]|nr:ABC transporter permease [Acidobacteriota bacterium]
MTGSNLRFAWRGLAKSPGFTAVAMLTLALGIGANTAIFSIVNGVLLKPLPFPKPEQLMVMNNSYGSIGLLRASTSPVDHVDYRRHTDLFQDVMSIQGMSFNYSGVDRAERWSGAAATASAFSIMAIRPIAGRMFTEDEDRPGHDAVAVLDEGLWKRAFGGRADVIGQTIRLNEKPYQVIGVVPQALGFLAPFEVWVPAAFTPQQLDPARRGNQSLFTVGRLAEGLSPEQAKDRLRSMTEELRRANPNAYPADSGWSIAMTPMTEVLTGTLAAPLFTLLAAVGFVLLIACANVANLLLARGAGRGREMGIRAALGATRRHLIAQMLAESVLLGLLSGLAGLAAGYGVMRALISLAPANFPRIKDVAVDGPVLLFTLGLSVLTGILFGVLPALQAGRQDLNTVLKDGSRGAGASLRKGRVRAALVVGEVALSTLLLVGAGLLVRSFLELQKVSAGFNPTGLISYRVSLPGERFDTAEKVTRLFDQIREKAKALPGVQSAGVVSSLPFSGSNSQSSFSIEGRDVAPNQAGPHGEIRIVSWDYFQTMQIPLKAGRLFTDGDRETTEPVAVVDENLAKLYWPAGDAVGKRIRRGGPAWVRIAGVVGVVKHSKLDAESKGAYYFVLPQLRTGSLNVMVRTAGDPAALTVALRRDLAAIDKDLPMFDVKTMSERVLDSLLAQRVAAWLLGVLASVALLLAAVGIYGVLSQTVQQRTAEIGIRMALGAQQGQVLGLVLREGLLLSGIGLAIGAAVALAASRLVEKLLFGVAPADLPTYAAVTLVLGLVAALACLAPAFRASRVDPLVALRYE